MIKTCSKCKVIKPASEFFTQKNGKYLQSWCKPCKYEQSAAIKRGRTRPERTEIGAYTRGESHHASKLTYDDVYVIKGLIEVLPCSAIAHKYGVHRTTISAIKTGRSWY